MDFVRSYLASVLRNEHVLVFVISLREYIENELIADRHISTANASG
jgi:hypothetical protein